MESVVWKQDKSLLRARVTMHNRTAIIKQNSLKDAFYTKQKKTKGWRFFTGELQMKVLILSSGCRRLWDACGVWGHHFDTSFVFSSTAAGLSPCDVQYSWALCSILTRVYIELQGISFSFGATTIFLSFCLQMIFQIGKSLCSQRLFNSACMFLLENCLAPILVKIATSSWHVIC